jgi:hypothetical protein
MDRTARNTNMLFWNKELWLIDHGAALYFHHSMDNWEEQAQRPFVLIKDHVLLPIASELDAVDAKFKERLTDTLIDQIVGLVPEDWLSQDLLDETATQRRDVYAAFLKSRVANSEIFVNEAKHARARLI